MDFLRPFFKRRKRYYRNFPIVTLNVDVPVKILDVNRLTYPTPDYVPKVNLPSTNELCSFLNPMKRLNGSEFPNPRDDSDEQEAPELDIPVNNFDEFLANITVEIQNWVHAQQQAALAAIAANMAGLDVEGNSDEEAGAGPQPGAPAADAQDEDLFEVDEAVNVHAQYEEAQHFEAAGGLVPLDREVEAGDGGAVGGVEDDVQEPSTPEMSGHSSCGSQE